MGKIVIVINGSGGSGKDTVVDIVAKHYEVLNTSSIAPIKEILSLAGVPESEFKTDAGRKLLSDVKMAFTEYNDLPFRCMKEIYDAFLEWDDVDIMFVHIREPSEIEHFVSAVTEVPVVTLLIENRVQRTYGNMADDNVHDYTYDYVFVNNGPLEELPDRFMEFFDWMIKEEHIEV